MGGDGDNDDVWNTGEAGDGEQQDSDEDNDDRSFANLENSTVKYIASQLYWSNSNNMNANDDDDPWITAGAATGATMGDDTNSNAAAAEAGGPGGLGSFDFTNDGDNFADFDAHFATFTPATSEVIPVMSTSNSNNQLSTSNPFAQDVGEEGDEENDAKNNHGDEQNVPDALLDDSNDEIIT